MLKWLYPVILIVLCDQSVFADIDVCLRDADTHGHHKNPLSPLPECENIIKELPNRLESVSPSGSIKAVGIEKMLYISNGEQTELLAGDQTYLKDISFISIDEKERKLIVYQESNDESAVMVYSVDFIGNVSPLSMDVSEDNNELSHISLLPDSEEIALVSSKNKKITFINMDSDHRYQNDGSRWKRKIKRVLSEESGINQPSLVTESKSKNEIYVLDGNRVLVFDSAFKSNDAPKRIITAEGVTDANHIGLNEDHSKIRFHQGNRELGEFSLD